MRIAAILAAVLAAAILAGCGGQPIPVPADKCAYVGEWSGPGLHMRLLANGEFDYIRATSGGQAAVRAPLLGFSGDDIRVGQWLLTSRFKVAKPPHKDADGAWKMTLEGVEVTRAAGASGCESPSTPGESNSAINTI